MPKRFEQHLPIAGRHTVSGSWLGVGLLSLTTRAQSPVFGAMRQMPAFSRARMVSGWLDHDLWRQLQNLARGGKSSPPSVLLPGIGGAFGNGTKE